MSVYLISDTHFNHFKIATYCQRPENFTEILLRNLRQILKQEDTLIHLGDVFLHKKPDWLGDWPGRKVLVRGNHDRKHGCDWWMNNGFDFACDGMKFRNCWLTHEPSTSLADGTELNLHGHLHNIWHGFQPDGEKYTKLRHPWQRLFAVEYTQYMPVEFDKFVSHPEKYQARGPK